jgi:hypothetical protein
VHYKELQDPKLTAERFSQIIKIVDAVSARMTLAYEANNTPPEVKKYFNIKNLIDATRYIDLKSSGPSANPAGDWTFCNGFLTRSGQDVYWALAKHSIKGTTVEGEYTTASNDADAAVKYIPPQLYGAWNVQILPTCRK